MCCNPNPTPPKPPGPTQVFTPYTKGVSATMMRNSRALRMRLLPEAMADTLLDVHETHVYQPLRKGLEKVAAAPPPSPPPSARPSARLSPQTLIPALTPAATPTPTPALTPAQPAQSKPSSPTLTPTPTPGGCPRFLPACGAAQPRDLDEHGYWPPFEPGAAI